MQRKGEEQVHRDRRAEHDGEPGTIGVTKGSHRRCEDRDFGDQPDRVLILLGAFGEMNRPQTVASGAPTPSSHCTPPSAVWKPQYASATSA